MNLDKDLGFLKGHAALVSAGITTEQALSIVTGEPICKSLTETYRKQLTDIATSVDVNINALLNMLSVDQIYTTIEDHRGIKWSDPDCDSREQSLTLSGVTKSEHGVWWLSFEVYPFIGDECSYQLHDLDIQDVLALLATVENVIGL